MRQAHGKGAGGVLARVRGGLCERRDVRGWQSLSLLEVRLHGEGFVEERRPVARQEVPALHFHSQAMHFQLLPQEGLFIEVVPPDEDEGCPMPKAFRGCAVPYLAKHAVCSIHLNHVYLVTARLPVVL